MYGIKWIFYKFKINQRNYYCVSRHCFGHFLNTEALSLQIIVIFLLRLVRYKQQNLSNINNELFISSKGIMCEYCVWNTYIGDRFWATVQSSTGPLEFPHKEKKGRGDLNTISREWRRTGPSGDDVITVHITLSAFGDTVTCAIVLTESWCENPYCSEDMGNSSAQMTMQSRAPWMANGFMDV